MCFRFGLVKLLFSFFAQKLRNYFELKNIQCLIWITIICKKQYKVEKKTVIPYYCCLTKLLN